MKWFVRQLVALTMIVLLVAGAIKLLDVPRFTESLQSWAIIPHQFIPLASILIPSMELALGGLWLAGIASRRLEWVALVFVLLISCAYCVEWAVAKPPECGCLGLLSRYWAGIESARHVILRNAFMSAVIAAGLTFDRSAVHRPPRGSPLGAGAARGFTLIEMLLVMVLIVILGSLTLPSLSKLRSGARATVSLSYLHGHAVIATQYAGDYKSMMPYATTPRPGRVSVVRCLSRRIAIPSGYFEMSSVWHIALADGYYDQSPWHPSLSSPLNIYRRQIPTPQLGTDYLYSCAFLASPEYFDDATHRAPPGQLRAVRLDEVSFPSAKFVFIDYFSMVDSPAIASPASFADGHAAKTNFDDTLMYQGGDGAPGESFPYEGHFPGKRPLPHTLNGVRGRDTR